MARLFSTGLETGVNGGFGDAEGFAFLTSSTNQTTIVRSGTYAFQGDANGENLRIQYRASNTQESCFYRAYVYVADYPGALEQILAVYQASPVALIVTIRMNSNGTLELWNNEDNAQVGSDSSALNLSTWYRIEINLDTTTLASSSVSARIDGVEFASGTINLAAAAGCFSCEIGSTGGTRNYYFDDVAVNDTSGSFQNSWPGEGEIIHLLPDSTGDNSTWSGDNTDIDEVTPDDNTTKITSKTLDEIEDVNLAATPVALASDDTINCVQVGVRFNISNATDPDPNAVLRIKASASGTVEESANLGNGGTTWVTNAAAVPRNYALTLYDLPGASTTAWTKADLDTTQIGVRETATDSAFFQVSTLWLLVDHKPSGAAPPPVSATGFMTTNTGFWGI